MPQYSLAHLSDSALLADTRSLVARDRAVTSELLAHLAEVDARRLYLPAAYPSMFAWCVGHLRLSEDSAFKRITAGRVARRFPAIFEMVSDGRLHLSGIVQLSPHLTEANASELLAAATHRSKHQIERLLAERFPRPDLETVLAPVVAVANPAPPAPPILGVPVYENSLAPGRVNICTNGASESAAPTLNSPSVQSSEPKVPFSPTAPAQPPARVTPLAPERFGLQVTVSRETHDKLQRARELLGHSVPNGDLAQVLDRALDALLTQLERKRFSKCARPGVSRRRADGVAKRAIPAAIKRQVWERDGGRCTFTSPEGKRCESRTRIEFDHAQPLGRGGQNTPSNLRLRCRAHNQSEAERAFGKRFMEHKRERTANGTP